MGYAARYWVADKICQREARMTRYKYEFPTEWSICPDANQDERKQPAVETQPKDQESQPAEPHEPRAFTAGGFASLPR